MSITDDQPTLNLGNTDSEVNQIASGGSSPTDHPLVSRDSENVYSTVEGETPGPSPDDAKQPDDAEKKPSGDEAASKGEEEKIPFHEHPRFKELISERQELRERLAKAEGMIEAIRKPEPDAGQRPAKLPYKDITQMSDEELREWQSDDPKGYAANLYAQVQHELRQELRGETQRDFAQKGIRKTFDDYAAKNPDFMQLWNSGTIMRFMQENPGHNAISAHMALKQQDGLAGLKKVIDAEVAKAVKETEARVQKNFMAKKRASVLDGSPSLPATGGTDNELKDTNSQGGLVAAITQRILRNRQARGLN